MPTRVRDLPTPHLTSPRHLASWAIIPAIVLMQFFDLRRALFGPLWVWSSYLVGFGLVTVVCLPLVWRRWHELSKPGRVMLAAVLATFGYALVTALVTPRPYVTSRTSPEAVPPDVWTAVPRLLRVVPLLTSVVTLTAALLLVWVIPAAQRLHRLWWATWTILLTTLVAWPRAVIVHDSPRLATGMGGSAILHLVLLLCAGLFLGSAWQRHHRRASLLGAGVAMVLVVMTGSRAGLLTLLVFLGLVLLWWLGRVSPRLMAGLAGAGAAVFAIGYAVVPQMRRLVQLADESRLANLEHASTIWTLSWQHVVFGAGSGRVWPWYAFDARYFISPWRSLVSSPFGTLLTNPHSVPLGTLVELGLVGAGLLAVGLAVPVVQLVRAWRQWRRTSTGPALAGEQATAAGEGMPDGARVGVLLAVTAGLVAFLFDHYLFKNYGVSFWWWVLVSFAVLVPPSGPGRPARHAPARSGEVSPPAPVA